MDADHQERLDDLSIEAQYELAQGDPARSVELCRTLVEEWTAVQGPDGERVLTWRGFLGRALTEARRYHEAEAVLGDLVVDRTRIEGPDASGTLVARGNLARAVAGAGRPREAIVLAEHLLADRTRILGADHPSTLDTRGHIAHFQLKLGEADAATATFSALLEDRERVLGPEHPDTQTTVANLAIARAQLLGTRDALDELRDEMHAIAVEHGPDHAATLDAMLLVAEQLLRNGEAEEALAVIGPVVEGRRARFGDQDARTLSAELTRSRCLAALRLRSEVIAALTGIVERADAAGLTDDVLGLAARADLTQTLAAWFATGLAPDEVIEIVREHHTVLVGAGARVEPDLWVRDVTDDVGDLLAAVDSGAWYEDDEED